MLHTPSRFAVPLLFALGITLHAAPALTQDPGRASWQERVQQKKLAAEDLAARTALAAEILAERERLAGRAYDSAWAESQVERLADHSLEELQRLLGPRAQLTDLHAAPRANDARQQRRRDAEEARAHDPDSECAARWGSWSSGTWVQPSGPRLSSDVGQ